MSEIRVSLLVIPEADPSSLTGLYTVLKLFSSVVPGQLAFNTDFVAPDSAIHHGDNNGIFVQTNMGIPIPIQRGLAEVSATDLLIIPSLFTDAEGEWQCGRYPEAIDWMRQQYARGSLLCSSCTGALLLAETGLLDDREATQHWAFEATFRRNFPRVRLNTAKVLVTTGEGDRIVMSGASAAWHDLLLHLIARFAGPAAARSVARFFLLQWHSDSQAPYIVFHENTRHDDSAILTAQNWLRANSHEQNPIETAVKLSGLHERSFARRFRKATSHTPINYVQRLRVEAAKHLLETTSESVDEISCRIGYEDSAFLRRIFKRITSLTPSAYRRKFRVVDGLKD